MTDNLDQLAGHMVALFRQAVPLANAEVDAIIQVVRRLEEEGAVSLDGGDGAGVVA